MEIINFAQLQYSIVRGLVMLLSPLFLIPAEIGILISSFINRFRYYLQNTFLVDALRIMYSALGVETNGNSPAITGGLFIFMLVLAVLLIGLGYIFSVFTPSASSWVNRKNVFMGIAVTLLLIATNFSVLMTIEGARVSLYQNVMQQVYTRFFSNDNIANAMRSNGTLVPVCAGSLDPAMQTWDCAYDADADANADNRIGRGPLNSSADLAAALIGYRKTPAEEALIGMPDRYMNVYLTQVSDPKNQDEVNAVIQQRYIPGMGVALMGLFVAFVGILESAVFLILDLAGLVLFIAIPITLVFSYFKVSEGLFSGLVSNYIKLVIISVVIGAVMPLMTMVSFQIGGFFAYGLVGLLLWGVAVVMSSNTVMGAFSMALNGVFNAVGLPGVSNTIGGVARTAGDIAKTTAGLGVAAATGGAGAAAGLIGLGAKGLGAVAGHAATGGAMGSVLGKTASALGSFSQKMAGVGELAKGASAMAAGMALSKTKLGQTIATLTTLQMANPDISLGEALKLSGSASAYSTGMAMASGGLVGMLLTADKFKQNALNELNRRADVEMSPDAIQKKIKMEQKGLQVPDTPSKSGAETEGRFFKNIKTMAEELKNKRNMSRDLYRPVDMNGNLQKDIDDLQIPDGFAVEQAIHLLDELPEDDHKNLLGLLTESLGDFGVKAATQLKGQKIINMGLLADELATSLDEAVNNNPNLAQERNLQMLMLKKRIKDAWAGKRDAVVEMLRGGEVEKVRELVSDTVGEVCRDLVENGTIASSAVEQLKATLGDVYVQKIENGQISVDEPPQDVLRVVNHALQDAIALSIKRAQEENRLVTDLWRDENGNLSNRTYLYEVLKNELEARGAGELLNNPETQRVVKNYVSAMTGFQEQVSVLSLIYDAKIARKKGENIAQYIRERYGLSDQSLPIVGGIITNLEQNPHQEIAPLMEELFDGGYEVLEKKKALLTQVQQHIHQRYRDNDPVVVGLADPAMRIQHISLASKIYEEVGSQVLSPEDRQVLDQIVDQTCVRMGVSLKNRDTIKYILLDTLRQMPSDLPVKGEAGFIKDTRPVDKK